MTIEALSADFLAATRPAGLIRDEKHVYHWMGGEALPSVTTIVGVLDKSGPLVGWAKRVVAETAIRNLNLLPTMVEQGGAVEAAQWLAKLPGYQRDTAADIGTRVHQLAEAVSRGQDVPLTEVEAPFIVAYREWMAEWKPRFLAAEEMVCSIKHGYAGTLDAIVEMAGDTWLLDYKTSKGTYPETALQLAGYATADFIGRPGLPRKFRIPKVTAYGVLHLRPEGYQVVPYAVDDDTRAAFLDALRLYRWREGQGQSVMGAPLGRRIG